MPNPPGWGSPWPASMFQPIGQLASGSYPKPGGPAPDGHTWDASLGFWQPTKDYNQNYGSTPGEKGD